MQLANVNSDQITTRTASNGRTLGTRVHFAGAVPASEIKAQLKAANPKLTTKELKAKANEVLRGESDIRWMSFDALMSASRSKGFVPDIADINKAESRVTAKLIRPEEVKTAPAAAIDPEKVIADRMGIKVEELRALYADKK